MSGGTPPVSQSDKDIGHWVLGYLMGAGVSCEDAKKVDWRKARNKARADGLEVTIHNIGPYLIEAARALTHN